VTTVSDEHSLHKHGYNTQQRGTLDYGLGHADPERKKKSLSKNLQPLFKKYSNKETIKKHTLNISMLTTPGPLPCIMFLSSSSLSPLGTFPTNSLCFACDNEHRKVLPCSKHQV
jgi:hypothetical protein